MEPCTIPVRLRCFPCENHNHQHPTCSSIQRLCFVCAIRFLQLDCPPRTRCERIKCLTCHTTCDPRTLHPSTFYEKDFLLMSLDTCHDYTCPYDCDFVGNHNMLERHLFNTCPHRFVFCEACLYFVRESDVQHKIVCPRYEACRFCHVFLPQRELSHHLSSSHGKKYCRYCRDVIDVESSHEENCMYRLVRCSCCHTSMHLHLFFQHVKTMRENQLSMIQRLETELVKEKNKFRDLERATPVDIE